MARRRLRHCRKRDQCARRGGSARPQRPQGPRARAQRPHRRLHPHRGDHRAGFRPRRHGDDVRVVSDLAGLRRARSRTGKARACVRAQSDADGGAVARRPARDPGDGPQGQRRGVRSTRSRRRRALRRRHRPRRRRRAVRVRAARRLAVVARDAQDRGARSLAPRRCAASPLSSARRWAPPAAGWKRAISRRSCARCSRRGCCTPVSVRKAPIRARWRRSSPLRSKSPARRSSRAAPGTR